MAQLRHFCTRKPCRDPLKPINFHPKVLLSTVLGAAFVLVVAFVINTPQVKAFWPFSTTVLADTGTIIPSNTTPVLEAATNHDPNPAKDNGTIALVEGTSLLADAGPSGTFADVASTTSGTSQISVYIVRDGDTLGAIAKLFGVSVNTIVWANSLGSTKAIHPGQTLVILPISGVEHVVGKGETLAGIAKKYHGDATEIQAFNDLASGPLVVGSTIVIPGGELTSTVPSGHRKVGANNPYRGGSGSDLTGYFVNPLPGGILTQSIHGWNAVDIGSPRGTPILAAAAGTVIIADGTGGWHGGYGKYVVITHPNGTETLYAHMTHVLAQFGQEVSAGEEIGTVGATGDATGPHLHFEVRGAQNPFTYCPVGDVCEPQ